MLHVLTRDTQPMKPEVKTRPSTSFLAHYSRTHFFVVRCIPERIRSKNERLSAQSFTRRYEMVRNTVTDRTPRAFKEQAKGSRRAERASERAQKRPTTASKRTKHQARVVCALRFFLCTKRILKKYSGPPEHARCASLNQYAKFRGFKPT